MDNPDDLSQWVVLVMEDDIDSQILLRQIFLHHGVGEIHIARDGREGLVMLETLRPTVILLDLSMPELNGWDTYTAIRENGTLADVPVLALTARALKEDRDKAFDMGFDDYIVKPYSIRTLVPDIQRSLQARHDRASDIEGD